MAFSGLGRLACWLVMLAGAGAAIFQPWMAFACGGSAGWCRSGYGFFRPWSAGVLAGDACWCGSGYFQALAGFCVWRQCLLVPKPLWLFPALAGYCGCARASGVCPVKKAIHRPQASLTAAPPYWSRHLRSFARLFGGQTCFPIPDPDRPVQCYTCINDKANIYLLVYKA